VKYFKVISSEGRRLQTDEVLHPGDVLEMELSARGIKKKFAAQQLSIQPSHLSELLKGNRHVSAMLAIRLEMLLDIEADFWLRVQSSYDLAQARYQLAQAA
jgi:antitoxin HigA-1